MEYLQMTLDDWLEMKQSLERELNNLKTGFIRVGYVLRKIEESRGYEQDGYRSIAEFAKAEYGLSPSTVSRFMAVNARFSLDGYSERLDPKYIGFHQSVMSEMLGLPDRDLSLVTPETSRQDVRELKQFNRQEPERGIAEDIRELIVNYFRENREELNELYDGTGAPAQEILNPSGNKVYRKGMYMMFFYTDCVKTKKFGGETTQYSWEEFRGLIDGVFGSYACADTYACYFEGAAKTEEQASVEEKKVNVDARTDGTDGQREVGETDQAAETEPERDGAETGSVEDMGNSVSSDGDAEGQAAVPQDEQSPETEAVQETAEEQAAESDAEEQAMTEDVSAEGPSEDAVEEPEEEAGLIAPAQIMPEPEEPPEEQQEEQLSPEAKKKREKYYGLMASAREKLEEIEKSFTESAWNRMSEQTLQLNFIAHELMAAYSVMENE